MARGQLRSLAWARMMAAARGMMPSILVAMSLVAAVSGCGTPSTVASSPRSAPPSDAPSRVVVSPRSSGSASIEVEKVGGEFHVKNLTHSPIACGAVRTIGWSPRSTVPVAALDSARIVEPVRHILACGVEMRAAAEMIGETEDELRRSLGASASEKLLYFEDRGKVSSSTVMLASSCETEPNE